MTSLEAVIEIGSTGIRLLIGEVSDNHEWTVIDHSEMPIALGWDVFTTGVVSRDSLLQCLKILNRFKEQIQNWSLATTHITVIATSAVREASNRDTVLDRILVKTGFRVKVIDGIEESRLMYIGVVQALQDEFPKLKKNDSVIIEVGGGSTEIMLLQHGNMAAVHSLSLGTVIIEQHIKSMMGAQKEAHRFLVEYIKNVSSIMNTELKLEEIDVFIAIGSEVRLAAQHIGKRIYTHCCSIPTETFFRFTDEIQEYSIEECAGRFKIPYSDAKTLAIGLLAYKLFIQLTKAKTILVPDTTIREGVLVSKLTSPSAVVHDEFTSQIIASAYNLGKRYHFDEKHAEFVRFTALRLFDDIKDEIGLDDSARMLLEVAALLHDIGMYIRGSDHHLHSQYIISHSDIFGVNKENMIIISNIARYHRGKGPQQDAVDFYSLSRLDRMAVLKLTAVLRVADALDRGHSQRIKSFDTEFKGDSFILKLHGVQDTILEKIAMKEKADMFESIFGYKVILV